MYNQKQMIEEAIKEIRHRQGQPWNDGRINDYNQYSGIQALFDYINSGIKKEDYFYNGKLYRIHSPQAYQITNKDNYIILREEHYGLCWAIQKTEYSNRPVAFSKTFDYTNQAVFCKVCSDETCIFLRCDTQNLYGIDVNAFLKHFGYSNDKYEGEQEVLFPILKDYIVEERLCTPEEFKTYMINQ